MAEDFDEHLARGYRAFADGQLESAVAIAVQCLETAPGFGGARLLRALALVGLRRPLEALPDFEALVSGQPAEASHWTNLGNCLMELERWPEALDALQRASALGDASEARRYAHARALDALGKIDDAERLADELIRASPDDPEIVFLKVRLLLRRDEVERAGHLMAGWIGRPMHDANALDAADALLQIGWFAHALHFYERAVPSHDEKTRVSALLGRTSALERLNRIGEAEKALDELDGQGLRDLPVAQRVALHDIRAQLAFRAGRHDEAVDHWHKALAVEAADEHERSDIELKLARAEQARGNVRASMHHAECAHARKLRRVRDVHRGLPPGDRLLEVLSAPVPEGFPRYEGMPSSPEDPVFVVGFPRSGTTLLEQFLDAHDALRSFDEQPFLHRRIDDAASWGHPYPEGLATLDATKIQRLRDAYFADVARIIGSERGVRAVDKNPLNLVRLPLVASLFPRSKVLLALRHPCDVVLSCFLQNFRSPAFAITFESLESTAAMYSKTMAHFDRHRSALDLEIHVVRYESFVADFDREARSVTAFLGLEWRDELSRFTERAAKKGTISTPSYSQVVRPVNTQAIGRWEAYRSWFERGALAHLEPWIEHWGY